MYEIKSTGPNNWQIYDTGNQCYVAHSRNHKKVANMTLTLQKKGFEGEIPAFFLVSDTEYGINLDKKMLSD